MQERGRAGLDTNMRYAVTGSEVSNILKEKGITG